MERIVEKRIYAEPIMGATINGDLARIIGEQVMEIDGEMYDQYIYNIEGFTPEDGLPFISLKAYLYLL